MRTTFYALIFSSFPLACKPMSNQQAHQEGASSSVQGKCILIAGNMPSRCMEFRGATPDQLQLARQTCGSPNHGLQGFMWQDGPCPVPNRIGECQENKAFSKNFFYSPAYQPTNAGFICSGFGGRFVLGGQQSQAAGSLQSSCMLLVNGMPARCVEFLNNNSPEVKLAKQTCGSEAHGLKGFRWQDTSCPKQNVVANCKGNNSISNEFYYSPSYTAQNAINICQSF